MKMTQEKIYNAETGRFVGNRVVHETKDGLWVCLEGGPFDCMLNEENNRFEV